MNKRQWIIGSAGFFIALSLGVNPFAFFIGALIAKRLDKVKLKGENAALLDEVDKNSAIIEGQRNGFLFTLLVLSSYLIQADNRICDNEMDYVLGFIRKNFGDDAAREAEATLKKIFETRSTYSQEEWKDKLSACCSQISEYLTAEQLDLLLSFLIGIAKADNDLADEELNALYDVCKWLNISADRVEALDRQKEETLMSIYDNVFEITDLM